MQRRKGEPGTHCLRMRPIFQDYLDIVFSPYISVDCDTMKSQFSKFCLYTGYIADIRILAPLFVLTRCVQHCVSEFTLSNRNGKRSLVESILWLK